MIDKIRLIWYNRDALEERASRFGLGREDPGETERVKRPSGRVSIEEEPVCWSYSTSAMR